MADVGAGSAESGEDVVERLFREQPQERLVVAIHRMSWRQAASEREGRFRRARWQTAALDRLVRALYAMGVAAGECRG